MTDGVDAEARDLRGSTPLLWAARQGDEAVVGLLLATGRVEPDSRDPAGRAPLWWAADGGHEAVVKLLLAGDGVEPDSTGAALPGHSWGTPLCRAAMNGHVKVVRLLLVRGKVDPDCKDVHHRTPLWWTARYGHKAVAELLLATERVDPNYRDERGSSPLDIAATLGHTETARLLLEKGARINDKYFFGWTALHKASSNGHPETMKVLLEYGAKPDAQDEDGRTTVCHAAAFGHTRAVQRLLEWHGRIRSGRQYREILQMAAYKGDLDLVRHLERMRNDIRTDSDDFTQALQLACLQGHSDVVQQLFHAGADPHKADEHGWTPLFCASLSGQQTSVQALLARSDLQSFSLHPPPPPNSWSKTDKSPLLALEEDGTRVDYIPGTMEGENFPAAGVRANNPIPHQGQIFYFEITVVDSGAGGEIGVGLCHGYTSLDALPGWQFSSWGYHGDDGKTFENTEDGDVYGPTYGTGDVIGCHFNPDEGITFFKNGDALGVATLKIDGKLYPVVGIRSTGASIKVNFGSETRGNG